MITKTSVQEKLKNTYSPCEVQISPENRLTNLSYLTLNDVLTAERVLNKHGYTISGICSNIPTAISLGMNGACLLVIKDISTGNLHWLSCFDYIIENWLEE